MSREISCVVVIVAMKQEADPFIQEHGLTQNLPSPFHPGSPMVSYSGHIGKVRVHLVWNGRCKIHRSNHVATTAAAMSTYASVAHFIPDLVVSAGTAGGFSELGACVGDVYISTKCVFHGRRIPISLANCKGAYLEEYGIGHFRCPALPLLAKQTGIKQGVVSTSDSLDCSDMDLQLLRSEGAVVKEMEAAAVAWVCQQLDTPFFALKAITDILDGQLKSEDEFYSNLELASSKLQLKLSLVLMMIGGTTLDSWGYSGSCRQSEGKGTSDDFHNSIHSIPHSVVGASCNANGPIQSSAETYDEDLCCTVSKVLVSDSVSEQKYATNSMASSGRAAIFRSAAIAVGGAMVGVVILISLGFRRKTLHH